MNRDEYAAWRIECVVQLDLVLVGAAIEVGSKPDVPQRAVDEDGLVEARVHLRVLRELLEGGAHLLAHQRGHAIAGFRPFDVGVEEATSVEERFPQLVDLSYELPERVPSDVAKAVYACLEPDPGNRPLPHEVAEYDIWHRRRLSMKPGITGLWQVEARHEPDFDRWVEHDLVYIDGWSIWLDLKILLKTIPALVAHGGR